ncbi:conserved hypothetical protein [Verticillium alfalfae VaMs.102]|uniref:Zn(2)-C6 fungal-type domain-containing protein n=1 Tax=Verticillium alfalfae (strain VaMs.102 / ATCC MYA-4576 / FGSC 10136) TaxID=526221 RepID=C9SKU1_VERA1|nr:conserved hypothetical protein [Verticillium alfalfae VaMs.102]EEY19309.1 conserved hypothetical protein [Verticillium alfalfae VaMs.102]
MTDHEKSRQRACRACTLAKRRCDKILPSCLRCVDRGVDCSYLPLKRRRYQPPSQRDVHAPRSDDPALADSHGHESHDRLRRSTVISIGADNEDSTTDSAGLRNLPLDTSLHTDLSNALSSSSVPPPDTSIQGDLTWFLPLSTWAQEPCTIPTTIPSAPVFSNFVRGLQTWLTRYLVKGHSPLIHRHLYTESQIPQDMRDAVAAIALSQTRTPENEHLTDSVSSAYLCALLTRHAAHPHLTGPQLTTIEHLARTQALLAHLLLALFTPSPPRRADAEAHLGTLLLWTRQFWDSAKLDAALCALAPSARPGTASPAGPLPRLRAHRVGAPHVHRRQPRSGCLSHPALVGAPAPSHVHGRRVLHAAGGPSGTPRAPRGGR